MVEPAVAEPTRCCQCFGVSCWKLCSLHKQIRL